MPKTASTSLVFDPEARYVTSYLCSPAVLGFIRLLLGLYSLVTNLVVLIWTGVHSGLAGTYFSYFTHLSYIGVTAWLWASGVQSVMFANAIKSSGDDARYPLQSWPRPLQYLHEFLFSTIATFPIIVTIVYWVLLATSDSFSDTFTAWSNISQHVMNTLFVLFELIFTNLLPLTWIQLPATIVLLGLYLGVAYVTQSTQGFYREFPSSYPGYLISHQHLPSPIRTTVAISLAYAFLDPQEQGPLLAGYILGIAAGQIIVLILVRYAIMLRICVVGKKRPATVGFNTHDIEGAAR
ncbi:hypothetical protein D9756_010598 [Leucocoprinus leucothites]|uniref:Uncharacterized protein n=1 Tax=Leucocoprinus leucothites TaxID=201217 RepID=A0A8H5FSA0_9AGAR|nr:hypothetical protein D9756_010598 [Leucoagaricus leucothites]